MACSKELFASPAGVDEPDRTRRSDGLALCATGLLQSLFCERLRAVAATKQGFVACVGEMLDEIVRMRTTDPALVRFLGTASFDLQALCRELVESAIVAGELEAGDLEPMVGVVSAMTVGLSTAPNLVPEADARAAEGFKRLLLGTLFTPPRVRVERSLERR
jgi:hypothetical protein